jgi:hypothetical protein
VDLTPVAAETPAVDAQVDSTVPAPSARRTDRRETSSSLVTGPTQRPTVGFLPAIASNL